MYETMLALEKVRSLLGIADDDNELDSKLELIIELVATRLKNLLQSEKIPQKFQYILVEVSIVRFNRIGSEGVRIDSVEGESKHYKEDGDFAEYMPEIEEYLRSKNGAKRVRFL